ncbi:hypothetical protein LCGC14_2148270 [marine sediment metagenome]|uniref:Uncharacterized protein n=1 Tax=marine sediment metagenome TaxID=412755 RepID=A0A0F9DW68_9ZZZZ
MTNTITRSDGVVLTLPDINVSNATNCSHHVSIDGIALEVTMAVRYLLADRERIKTQLADAKEELNKLEQS